MIAYNSNSLDNKYIREQAREALDTGCISPEEYTALETAHPVNFYTPNIFICIGLFLLTAFTMLCIFGLFLLMGGSDSSMIILLLFFGVVSYAAAEFIVRNRFHYKSGVDLGLIWISAALFFSTLFVTNHNFSGISICIVLFFISLFFALRFVNFIMSLVAYSALLILLLNITAQSGNIMRLIAPFILIILSAFIYVTIERIQPIERLRHYRQSLIILKATTLLSFYLAGNYFVVSELGTAWLGIRQPDGVGLPMGWLFWLFTIVIPFLYIGQGIRKKDPVFLWTGMALIACTVFTIRFYFQFLPLESAMIVGGIILITVAYGLIKYLQKPRHGFTSLESGNKHILEKLQIESLVIAETFKGAGTSPPPDHDFKFGGGSGGGAGAGGTY